MKTRLQLVFIAAALSAQTAPAQTVTWLGTTDSDFNNSANWSGGSPSSLGEALFTSGTTTTAVNVSGYAMFGSLTFSGAYPSYRFTATGTGRFSLASGINVASQSGSSVYLDSTLGVELAMSQTWTVNGPLTVNGVVSGGNTATLTKAGAGTLTLGGANTFAGGLNLQAGRVDLRSSSTSSAGSIVSGPAGTGTITLAAGTMLGAPDASVRVDNPLVIDTNTTLRGGALPSFHFELGGPITFSNTSTALHVAGSAVILWGDLNGPAGTTLTVDGAGALVFLGTPSANITSIVADGQAGLSFESASSLPATLSVGATNHGYVSVAGPDNTAAYATAQQLLARITAPASFVGTFGFDSDPGLGVLRTYAGSLDFSAFTDPGFRIGSGTYALLTGAITPPTVDGARRYAFGGTAGYLVIGSALTDIGVSPASVLVSSVGGNPAQTVVLRGANTFTGTTTFSGVTAGLVIDNGLVVLDSAGALPAPAKFAYTSGLPGYVGYTESTAFTSFADFASHLLPAGYTSSSILGVDSHSMMASRIHEGASGSMRILTENIDLRAFGPVALGTATNLELRGTVSAPNDGILRLAPVNSGTVTLTAPLGTNVNSVVIGLYGTGMADGTVELRGENTYAGGTTIFSGTLLLGNGAVSNRPYTPLGSGALTIEQNGTSWAPAQLQVVPSTYPYLRNPIMLNAPLPINGSAKSGTLNLGGVISGTSYLKISNASVGLNAHNTYSGGTSLLSADLLLTAADALGTGALTVSGNSSLLAPSNNPTIPNALRLLGGATLKLLNGANFTGAVTLYGSATIDTDYPRDSRYEFSGPITGSGSTLSFHGADWSGVQLRLSGANTYTGGTNATGVSVLFMNAAAIPASGRLASLGTNAQAGYIGAAFTTGIQTSFLDRFDKSTTIAALGFDSADPASPNVFSEAIDLTGFNPSVRLGSATYATLTGTITPAGPDYFFGDGGGTLIVQSALTGNRQLLTQSPKAPLMLVLQGTNTYSGSTQIEGTYARFDGAAALPAGSALHVGGYGYFGITEKVPLTVSQFIARFNYGNHAVLGFDTSDLTAPRVINDPIALNANSTFDSFMSIGTSTALILNGALTPVGSELRLAAVYNGKLVVNTPITSGSLYLGIGRRTGSVTLNGANTFAGGTVLDGSTVEFGNSSALGTGPVTVQSETTIAASAPGVNLANSFTGGWGLRFGGNNDFTLSGTLNGDFMAIGKIGTSVVTLSGHNSAFGGWFSLQDGGMVFAQDDSAGKAAWMLNSTTCFMQFLSANPKVGGLIGGASGSQIRLADNSTLTITGGGYLSGAIVGNASIRLRSETTGSSVNPILIVYGPSTYTGSTTIERGTLQLGASNSLPAGTSVFLTNSAAVLDLASFTQTIGSLDGAKSSTVALGDVGALTAVGTGMFAGTITGGSGSSLTKAGAGSLLLLAPAPGFSGSVVVSGGELAVGGNQALGTGTVTLASGSTLAARTSGLRLLDGSWVPERSEVVLPNAFVAGTDATFNTGLDDDDQVRITGSLSLLHASMTLHFPGRSPMLLQGPLNGAAGSTLTIDGGGSLVLLGTTSSNLASLVANGAGLVFGSNAALPATISVNAINGGYVSVAKPDTGTAVAPSLLLSRISTPAAFQGTFGFDSSAEKQPIYAFADNLDFSAFTDPQFRLGSGSAAILSGAITPPVQGGVRRYAFGGADGVLLLASSLADVGGTPAAVLVDSAVNQDPQTVIFRAANTFSGTVTAGSVTAGLLVSNGIVVLDAPGALPAASTLGFAANTAGYIGTTQYGFGSFADLVARLAPGGYNARSILGVDSHDFITQKSTLGTDTKVPAANIAGPIDLSSLGSIYLGTMSNVTIGGPVFAPADGVLRVTAADEGRLALATPLGANVASLVIGRMGPESTQYSDGLVELLGDNTFTGGTTLLSGSLAVSSRWAGDHLVQPLGTGTLTVAAGGSSRPTLTSGTNINNPIVLGRDLQIGRPGGVEDPLANSAGSISLSGVVSGTGSLDVFHEVALSQNNTYSGGTHLNGGSWAMMGTPAGLGTGPISTDGTAMIGYWGNGDLTLANALYLNGTLETGVNAGMNFSGPITLLGPSALSIAWGQTTANTITGVVSGTGSLRFTSKWGVRGRYLLSAANTYSGGTSADNQGAVVFMNAAALPATGTLTATTGPNGDGYIGAAFTANTSTGFLGRFDRAATNGTIGFDSANPAAPSVFTDNVDLTGFNSAVRLGTSSIAILAGTITPPAGANYRFNGAGTLIVSSPLSGARVVEVNSSLGQFTLELNGTNSFTGGTNANAGAMVRFASATALPSSGVLNANGGYIGITEAVGLTIAQFLAKFSPAANGVIGWDTGNPAAPRTVADPISLAGNTTFASAYLGTSTNLTLSGALTPYSSDLRLAAVGTGMLTVSSAITSGSVTVGAGTALSQNATTILSGTNTYTGGTQLNGGRLLLGNAMALGTGPLQVWGGTLGTTAAGFAVGNAISVMAANQFTVDASNDLTLGGLLSGAQFIKTGAGTLTLAAHNPGIADYVNTSTTRASFQLNAGRLVLAQNDSLGSATLNLGAGATAEFLSSAPILRGLANSGAGDYTTSLVKLTDGAVLTIDGAGYFGGVIAGNAALTIANTGSAGGWMMLDGLSTYTGGTTVRSGATLRLGRDTALGSGGALTIDGGTVSIRTMVPPSTPASFTFGPSHPLVFNSGRLVAAGPLATDSTLRIGANCGLVAGDMQQINTQFGITPATLSLTLNGTALLVFDSAGKFDWRIADASAGPGAGWSRLAVTGAVQIAANSTAPFNFVISSVDNQGLLAQTASFDPGRAYSWVVLTATSITGFDAASFSIDASSFQNMPINAAFTLSVNDLAAPTTLLLNYNPAAVPEPATWVLLLTGLLAWAIAGARRRR
jgi:autotransporter-associated beta strand protein